MKFNNKIASRQNLEYAKLVKRLKCKIQLAQQKAGLSVNKELIILYWEIGRSILEKQQKEGWGAKIIDNLSRDLSHSFPSMKGFSTRNLKYMRKFAGEYSNFQIVHAPLAQITWYHNLALMEKATSINERLWYANQTIINGWSRNILVNQIESKLYKRQVASKKTTNFKRTLPAPQSDLAEQMLKDPYKLDFLTIGKEAREKEVENELVKPEYAGKINFYLSALDDRLKQRSDNPSIGIILCKTKNKITAEYALKDMTKPIGIAEYKLVNSIPKEFKTSLPTIEEIEAELKRGFLKH